jgi:hypothetical protein
MIDATILNGGPNLLTPDQIRQIALFLERKCRDVEF